MNANGANKFLPFHVRDLRRRRGLTDPLASGKVLVSSHVIQHIKYVIFPDNKWIQLWDLWMILAIWWYAFAIPFSFGISRGYISDTSMVFWVITLFINISFFVDTFLPFFRSYPDKNGRLVFSLKRIMRHYIRSGLFFLNLLASMPVTSIIHWGANVENNSYYDNEWQSFGFLSLFKLLRIIRIKKMMANSYVLNNVWERIDIDTALSFQFLLKLVVVSHMIACMWGWIAFMEAGSFSPNLLLNEDNPNWIQSWYKTSFVKGGLNPVGYQNTIPRYFLALFWAIQSLTSIGYGNIQPVTLLEYIIANALMLLCGIFWAYIIGKLVEVVASKGSIQTAFTSRMNEANSMIRNFVDKDLPESVIGTVHTDSSERIRHFITGQRENATKSWFDPYNACTLHDAYPTLRILSPELQRVTALHLGHSLLETVPYLSSKYLSPEEQAVVILQSVTLEFSSGERFVEHPDLGRGCLIVRSKIGFVTTSAKTWRQGSVNVDEVLLGDDYSKEHRLAFHFVGFTKALFVPRSVIMKVLESNERAWKECARWRYFMAAFLFYSLKIQNSEKSQHLDFGSVEG